MAATLTRKYHPINPEVIDSPACTMPQYTGYDTKHLLVTGGGVLISHRDLDTLMENAVPWGRPGARIVRVPLAPIPDDAYGDRTVGYAPTAGGTWGGRCGSMIWVPDTDHCYADQARLLHALGGDRHYIQDTDHFDNDLARLTQAWWVNGIATRRNPATDGFYVECKQTMRHLGDCTALDLAWDWRDYAPWTDQGAGTQLVLF